MTRTSPRAGTPSRASIIRALTEVYAGPAWHGPSVRQALRRLTPERAAYRAAPRRNTGWELALHLSAARHIMLQRVTGADLSPFPRKRRATWWPVAPAAQDAAAWRADVALLEEYQRRLLAAVARAPLARLALVRPGRRWTIAHELLGMAVHDAYHAGQMILLAGLAGA